MDQNFQTSFIPKKPIIESKVTQTRPVGLLTIFSFFIFFSVAIASGAVYFYKKTLTANIAKMDRDLNLSKNRFEPKKIAELKALDTRLRAATQVLSKHVTISPVFELLQKITMQTVRYTQFDYSIDDQNSKIVIKMAGQAVDYRSVALQSDIFTEHKELIDPVFSGLVLDDKKGTVNFSLDFSMDSSYVNYKQSVLNENEDLNSASALVPNTSTPAQVPNPTSNNTQAPITEAPITNSTNPPTVN